MQYTIQKKCSVSQGRQYSIPLHMLQSVLPAVSEHTGKACNFQDLMCILPDLIKI